MKLERNMKYYLKYEEGAKIYDKNMVQNSLKIFLKNTDQRFTNVKVAS